MSYSNHCKQLLDKLNKQREAGFLCDCTIFIGEFQFKAHRNVLASFSEYFGAFFKDALDSIVLLDQKQVTPAGFQTLLNFIYSGDLHFDSCNIEEIHLAAEHLRLEDALSKCKDKMESLVSNSCVTKLPHVKNTLDSPEVSSQFHTTGATNVKKTKATCAQLETKTIVTVKKPPRNKKWKKTMRSHQKVLTATQNQPVNQINTFDLTLDANKLSAEKLTQDSSICLLQCPSTIECETLFTQDITIQTLHVNQKTAKLQQDYALKEHCMSNIASATNVRKMESSNEELAENYLKNKPVCNTCGKVFSEASSLRRHMRIHKGVKPYVCHLCAKAFTQCNQLKTHVRTHTGEKPYQCKLCDKGFAQKCQLVFHSRMHHGEEKPYKCDACNLQFATSSNLKIHLRKHSGEKPYVCDRCGQRFAQASTLTYHVRRHTGEKPYVCDTCGRSFAVSSSLITHARKHTGEKPYTCRVCAKSFISSGELNKHIWTHTGERPFVCDLCGNSYTDVKNLKKHKSKMHHGTEKTTETLENDNTLNEEDHMKNNPLQDNLDLKPEFSLSLTLPIGPEDHQMLLPLTDSQCLSSETLLRSSATNYSEPQFIFLQQLY
ncbi:myoneurin [Bombina bombina]|uniref:myoneurin n=1 Tax=Bombina bombina TaxID=8345 RepID=UPI00235ADE1B|nr:myoneurin [Bombina bombina]